MKNFIEELEKALEFKLSVGRNIIAGFKVDIEDQDPSEGLAMEPVDSADLKGLARLLKRKGFKVEVVNNSIVIYF